LYVLIIVALTILFVCFTIHLPLPANASNGSDIGENERMIEWKIKNKQWNTNDQAHPNE